MQIGISGASGHLGRAVLSQLATHGADARLVGISRTPGLLGHGFERRHGDYDRPETLADAYAGLDRLLLIPSAELRAGVRGAQLTAAIDAAVAAGVGHIVLMSAVGTRRQHEPDVGAAYWTGEQHLIRTSPRWTIVRMGYYIESFAQEARMAAGSGMLAGLRENRVAFVSRDDVAAAVASVLLGDGHDGATYSVTGPAAISGAQRAAAASSYAGTPFSFVVVSEAHLRGGLAQAGLPTDVVDAVVSIQQGFAAGAHDIVTGDIERLTGRAPRSLDEVLATLTIAED